ncbi:MAG: HAMP domain-containing sensor histidine kinase [Ghiorsea sp.]
MIHTLYARLALTLAVVLGLVGLIYVVLMTNAVKENTQYAEQILNRDLAKTLVSERNLVHENALDKKALQDMFMAYMNVNPSIEIYLTDLKGKILSYSADPGQVKRTQISLEPIYTFLKKDAMFPLLGDDPRSENQQKVFSVSPVPENNAKGYLYVILRGEQYDEVEQFAHDKELLSLSIWVVSIALLISLLLGLVIFYPITRRLRELSKQVDDFRGNEFKILPDLNHSKHKDELQQLENNVELMAKQMVSQLNKISSQDTQRRDLFASLSHDLRTPLATLHGYLETLEIKAETLDPEQRLEYTKRAIQFGNRLKVLVDELFEMAKLDMLEVAPNIEPFSLPELVQDIVQQFGKRAQQVGVKLQFQSDKKLPFVEADIGLIQRVFENLIGNALRHVQAGDNITICLASLSAKDALVEVSVADTGCGMADEDLAKIFEPLYQVNNTHRGGEHSGLGLTIVRRILELHDADIQVSSVIGQGSKFIFRL